MLEKERYRIIFLLAISVCLCGRACTSVKLKLCTGSPKEIEGTLYTDISKILGQ